MFNSPRILDPLHEDEEIHNLLTTYDKYEHERKRVYALLRQFKHAAKGINFISNWKINRARIHTKQINFVLRYTNVCLCQRRR